jgi:hypothetical protein
VIASSLPRGLLAVTVGHVVIVALRKRVSYNSFESPEVCDATASRITWPSKFVIACP